MSETATTAPENTKPEPRARDALESAIANLAGRPDPERIGAGPLAELRRMDDAALPPPAFWRLLLDAVPETLRPPAAEPSWALIIGGMARTARRGRSPHARGTGIGRALTETGYAEARLVRLLRASGDQLTGELRAACAWLDNKGCGVDWVQLATFVLGRAAQIRPFDAENAARAIARDYFRTSSGAQAETETTEVDHD